MSLLSSERFSGGFLVRFLAFFLGPFRWNAFIGVAGAGCVGSAAEGAEVGRTVECKLC